MLQPIRRATVVLLGLLATAASTAASAHDREYDDRGYYRSEPQIRLGVDLIWGGYAYAPPRPPVVFYPSRPYYESERYGYRSEWRGDGRGRGHRKHDRRRHRNEHRWDD